jgi:enolase-phosphatase E1
MSEIRAILLDIEGTTTPIAFVHEVLFSYAREHVREFLENNVSSEYVLEDIALLTEDHVADVMSGETPPELSDVESVAAYVQWLIERDRKSTGLKSLQGKIWRQGYMDGSLRAQVYADVAPAFERWKKKGWSIGIFSSGSVLAQKLLFAHTDAGDLSRLIDHYFDTNVGKKGEAESYRRIAELMRVETEEVLFVSDVVVELDAAREAGMKTLLSIRPGNPVQERAAEFKAIESFEEI